MLEIITREDHGYFDGNITNWKDVSGIDQDILIFRFSDLTNYYAEEELGDEFQYVPQKISELVAKEPGIIPSSPSSIYWKTVSREKSFRKRKSHWENFSEGRNGIRPRHRLRYSD